MDQIKGKHLAFNLLPSAPGTCPECGIKHEPKWPHNRDTMFYNFKFFNDNGRWPTWEDAMAHSEEKVKVMWREELIKRGIDPAGPKQPEEEKNESI